MSTSTLNKAELPPLTNVLDKAKSPYLLQHKSNPVHWQEWNAQSIERARKEDKMIFLSVGYSSCHWCHVQAAESFSDETVADMMNKYYINIKVDREERPDVDRMYMTYLQATSGGGGWPMSIFLTPTLEPVFAGTYFPRGKFMGLLDKISELWIDERERVMANGKNVIEQLKEIQESDESSSTVNLPQLIEPAVTKIFNHLSKRYDPANGGFSRSGPKFPSPSQNMVLLSRIAAQYAKPEATEEEEEKGVRSAEMGMRLLKALWMGGVRDWIGSGLARYSVDEYFRLPHFEKMLYDQGQVALSALEFSLLPNLPEPQEENRKVCQDLAADIIEYVSRDLVSKMGGIYSAEDADSGESFDHPERHSEGVFYVWTKDEFDQVLGEDSDIAAAFWNVKAKGNVNPAHDAHDELAGKNTLYQTKSYEQIAAKHKSSTDHVRQVIQRAIPKLREYRDENRPRPHLDDKILVSWNGLMITALAQASVSLPADKYPIANECLGLAEGAVDFVRREMYDESTGVLVRSWREGKGPKAQADDYAFFIQALLRLYSVTGTEKHLTWAIRLQEKMDEVFQDKNGGGYWASEEDELVLVRMKEAQDGAEPAATSVAVHNLFQLAHYCSDRYQEYRDKAESILKSNEGTVSRSPYVIVTAVAGAWDAVRGIGEYVITGAPESAFVRSMLHALHGESHIPNKVVIRIDPKNPPHELAKHNAVVKDIIERLEKETREGKEIKESLRVCRDFACGLPIHDLEEAKKEISG